MPENTADRIIADGQLREHLSVDWMGRRGLVVTLGWAHGPGAPIVFGMRFAVAVEEAALPLTGVLLHTIEQARHWVRGRLHDSLAILAHGDTAVLAPAREFALQHRLTHCTDIIDRDALAMMVDLDRKTHREHRRVLA
ncbi:MAG TPA: hypothetical protein VEH84_18200 [Alphaproteobacteria bacterium]|nr:hypothetical protein [Alphaproteobacteria bacterium]